MKKNKKENKDDDLKMENYWDVFWRNYKNVPGFRDLIKLIFYFLFFIFFIVVVAIGSNEKKNDEANTKKEEKTTTKIVYKNLIDELENKNFNVDIVKDGVEYKIDYKLEDNNLVGYVETDMIHKIVIKDNKVYEIVKGEEIENNELINNINLDLLNPNKLITILTLNNSTKIEDNDTIQYNYEIEENGINYTVSSIVKDNKISEITIKNNDISYHYIIN